MHLSKFRVRAAGQCAVHQITGSKVVTLTYFSPYRISNPVGATLLLAEQVGSPENERFSPHATAADCRYLCSFFPSGKKEPKKVLPSCAAATISRGISANPALLSAEMRCRLTRCTCISQNLAFAPRNKVLCIKSAVLRLLC